MDSDPEWLFLFVTSCKCTPNTTLDNKLPKYKVGIQFKYIQIHDTQKVYSLYNK